MYYVTKDLQDYCYTHRLGKGYVGKCASLHGHNAFLQVTLRSPSLNQYDMVMDFGDIKKLFNTWVQDNWDHACLVSNSDTSLLEFLVKENQKHFVIPANQNSTAEYMSRFLFDKFTELLRGKLAQLVEVKVWETKDSYASWSLE